MTMHSRLSYSAAMLAVAGFVAAAFVGAAQAREVKLAHLAPTDDPRHKSLVKFAKAIEDRTGGALKIKIYPSSTLGKDREVLEQEKGGLTELALNGEIISNFYKKWSVINLPYMWRDQQHVETFLASDIAKRWVKETTEQVGVQILGFYARNPRILVTRGKAVHKVEDLKGLKIRVPNIQVYMDTWKAFGVQPAPMASSEFILALKTGTVDGMENPIELMYTWKIYEIAKNLSYTKHMQARLFLTASKKFLDSLPDDQRKIVIEEAAKSQADHFKGVLDSEAEMENLLLAKGMIIDKTPDLSGFKARAEEVRRSYVDIIGRDDYEAIKNM